VYYAARAPFHISSRLTAHLCFCALCSCGVERHPFVDVIQSEPAILINIAQPFLHRADFTQTAVRCTVWSSGVD
jgi:hypothetical protein